MKMHAVEEAFSIPKQVNTDEHVEDQYDKHGPGKPKGKLVQFEWNEKA